MPFEFPPCLAPFVADTGGHLSLFQHHWDRGEEFALALKPFDAGVFIGPKSSISSELEILCGMPEIERFNVGVEAFGERPIVLCTICGDHQLQVRILAP